MTIDVEPPSPAATTSGTASSSRPRPAWVRGAAVGGAVACGCAAIALVDPTDTGVPVCWSAGVFGVDCPLCGGLRCVNSLARGDLMAAADHNVLLAVALPLVAVTWLWWMVASVRGRPARLPTIPAWAWVVVGLTTVAFTIVRNMELGPVAQYLAATAG